MSKNRLYIAYGSNLNLPQMGMRCPTAEVVGTSEIKNCELLFRGGRRGAVATIEPLEGSSVTVLLWKIKQQDELALDRYEGFP
ncbi:MAG: gamma-glutamylcyclotransferase family protein, partial [Hungatella sp.]